MQSNELAKQPHSIGCYAAWIVAVLVLYGASYGPATYVYHVAGKPAWFEKSGEVVYFPVVLLSWSSIDARHAISWYTSWWADLGRQKR